MIDRRKLMNSFTQEAFTKAVEKVARPETE